jgi:hypothetical protein
MEEENKEYSFFVTYAFRGGFGNVHTTRPQPNFNWDGIMDLQADIKGYINDDSVIILDWKPID